ncbi:hypothetical protein M885DRAFT_528750 [Pelagophyceae sp. CCMP2097]|nr:hypothetical protein M885DRAFT_528750 [Pelagophyceae sp. CCMP2097]
MRGRSASFVHGGAVDSHGAGAQPSRFSLLEPRHLETGTALHNMDVEASASQRSSSIDSSWSSRSSRSSMGDEVDDGDAHSGGAPVRRGGDSTDSFDVGLTLDDSDADAASIQRWAPPQRASAQCSNPRATTPCKRVRFSQAGSLFTPEKGFGTPRRLNSKERLVLREIRPDLDVRDSEWAQRVRAIDQAKAERCAFVLRRKSATRRAGPAACGTAYGRRSQAPPP